ncbi:hypothetical protein BG000_009866 [Podila horticola]|nr:hypothetical protein BG000_009866 [Podila horticola]
MLAKSVCVLVNSLAMLRVVQPPPAAVEDMTEAEKQKNQGQFKDKAEDRAVEILLTGPSGGHVVVVVEFLPYLWAMHRGTVDSHLDVWHYIVKIMPDHRLIKTGPYRYLIHPSYTGAFLCMVAFQGALFDQHWAWIQSLVPFLDLPWWSGVLLYSWLLSRIFTTRARNEEAVMAAHFGAEWDERPIPPGRPSAPFPYLASQFEIPPRGIPVYKPVSTTAISQYSLKNTAITIRTLLLEWIAGLGGSLSIQELNRHLGTLWRVRGERNLYNSRATIVREFKRLVDERGMAEEEAVNSLQQQLGKNAFLTLPVGGNMMSTMRYAEGPPKDEFVVADDELNEWKEVKEEEERASLEPHSRNVKENGDERSKSKKRQRPGSSQMKKVVFDGRVRVKLEEDYSRVKLEDEDSP